MEAHNPMIHQKKQQYFMDLMQQISAATDFEASLIEKDYYLTLLLSKIDYLCPNLAFKGGTCLNKIYFDYHRLSEDLDFTMVLPHEKMTRKERSELMKPVKEHIKSFVEQFDMKAEDVDKSGHSESTIYNFKLIYDSLITNKQEPIQLDISLRGSPLVPTEKKEIRHKFIDQFGTNLINTGKVKALSLKEALAEKIRAGITREIMAPRDFYDLDYAIRNNFDFKNKDFAVIVKKKLAEEEFDTDLKKYAFNLGRTSEEISRMKKKLSEELYPVLTQEEKVKYDVNKALERINDVVKTLSEETANYDAYNPNYEVIERGESPDLPAIEVKIENPELKKKLENIEWRNKEIKERIEEIEYIAKAENYSDAEKIAINKIFATDKGAKILETNSFSGEDRINAVLYLETGNEKYSKQLPKSNQIILKNIEEEKIMEIDEGMSL
jgi:predicted nucleotidyltransferase component of viral defense system